MKNLRDITELPLAESASNLNLIVNDNGTAKQIPAGLVGAQSDYNENDVNSPAFIKNRPFYEIPGDVLYDGDIQFQASMNGNDPYYPSYIEVAKTFEVGKFYIITINDEECLCVCEEGTDRDLISLHHSFLDGGRIEQNHSDDSCYIYIYPSVDSGDFTTTHLTIREVDTVHKIDEKYLPDSIVNKSPIVLNASEDYTSDSAAGDEALNAIMAGRQILVRVPNADGGNYTAIHSPVMMYQLPNFQNQYLYLFFLRDEKQDLSALVGLPDGSVMMPTYGQLKMLLSREYNSNPLEEAE